MQRRGATLIARVRVGASFDKDSDGLRAFGAIQEMQRRIAGSVPGHRVGAGVKQRQNIGQISGA